ncbi:hypothetical protein AB0O63_36875, partial [Streptomyces cyaneofuscatus]
KGFTVNVTAVESEKAEGTVIKQKPDGGSQAEPLGPSGAGPVVRHGQGPPGPEFMIGGGVRKDYRGQHPYPGVRTMQTGGGPYAPPGAGAGASGRRRVSRAQRR